jgi:hypothetical protein
MHYKKMAIKQVAFSVGKVLVGVGALLLVVDLLLFTLHLKGSPLVHLLIWIATIVITIASFKSFPKTLWLLALIVLGYLSGGIGGTLILLGALIALIGSYL